MHLSGGVGIGGVLEPMQAGPTIIEDNCFIGARSEVVEGCIVREGSVLGMGVFIGKSTKIVDRATGEVTYGEVPPYSVVVAGSMPSGNAVMANGQPAPNLYCAVIVKRVDEKTRSKTGINELLAGLTDGQRRGGRPMHDLAVLQPLRPHRPPALFPWPGCSGWLIRRFRSDAQMLANEGNDSCAGALDAGPDRVRPRFHRSRSPCWRSSACTISAIPGRWRICLFIPVLSPVVFIASLSLAGRRRGRTNMAAEPAMQRPALERRTVHFGARTRM